VSCTQTGWPNSFWAGDNPSRNEGMCNNSLQPFHAACSLTSRLLLPYHYCTNLMFEAPLYCKTLKILRGKLRSSIRPNKSGTAVLLNSSLKTVIRSAASDAPIIGVTIGNRFIGYIFKLSVLVIISQLIGQLILQTLIILLS